MRPFSTTNALMGHETLRGQQNTNALNDINLKYADQVAQQNLATGDQNLQTGQSNLKQTALETFAKIGYNMQQQDPQTQARWMEEIRGSGMMNSYAQTLGIDPATMTPDTFMMMTQDMLSNPNLPARVKTDMYLNQLPNNRGPNGEIIPGTRGSALEGFRAGQQADILGAPAYLQPGDPTNPIMLSDPRAEIDVAADRAGAVQAATDDASIASIAPRQAAETLARRTAEAPAQFSAAQGSLAGLSLVSEKAMEVYNHPGLEAAVGFGGETVSMISDTDARNAAALLQTLKANVFAGALKAMRDASATGGAVGQVSDAEGARFENMWGSLDQTQDFRQFQNQLMAIARFTEGAMQRIKNAYQREYGEIEGAEQFNATQPEFGTSEGWGEVTVVE